MEDSYKIVYEAGEAEIIEKKSRFIATVCPVQSEEEATAFIEETKKKYWNATHNCTAFTIGKNNELTRCNDDGEPSGTAGKPMLDVILMEEIHDVAVVVTRYFGGTLLGTGGLVRAYQKSVQEGLKSSTIITKDSGRRIFIKTDYNGIGKIQYIIAQNNIFTCNTEYSDVVEVEVIVPENIMIKFSEEITEGTNGRSRIKDAGQLYYGILDKKIILF